MKGKTKQQKGITLIALIITIVVLLILAAVAISSIQNDGILRYAQNAAKDYNQAQKDEQGMLGYYEAYLGGVAGKWVQNGTTVSKTTPEGTVTLTVGDYVNYVSGVEGYNDTNGWRVLGAKDGQILLLSTNFVASDYLLSGTEDYFNGISKLDGVCAPYGNGQYADSRKTRSINVDDINRVTGYNPRNIGVYDPNQIGTGETYYEESLSEYGNEVTYTLTSYGEIEATGSNGAWGGGETEIFEMPDGTQLTSSMTEGIKVTSTYYYYYTDTLTSERSGDTVGLTTDSQAYSMLFKSPNTNYWLGSSFVHPDEYYVMFGMRRVYSGNMSHYVLWYSDGGDDGDCSSGVRAVVSLQSDVKLTSSGSNSWTLSK